MMDFIYIQNKYKQSKLYLYFSIVPAKGQRKYRETEGKQAHIKYTKYFIYGIEENFTNTTIYPQ